MKHLDDTHRLQTSVKASRASITPVLCEWTDWAGGVHTVRQPLMIEARGSDGSYVRGYTDVIMIERDKR